MQFADCFKSIGMAVTTAEVSLLYNMTAVLQLNETDSVTSFYFV